MNEIQTFYAPGAKLVILSDGRVFADIINVSDETLNAYRDSLINLLKSDNFQFFSMDDVFSASSPNVAREKLMATYGGEMDWVDRKIHRDADFKSVYLGFLRFMEMDQKTFFSEKSKSERKRIAGVKAKDLIRRNEAYSNLCNDIFPNHIRLSIHSHPNIRKFGVTLIPSDEVARTPWHSVTIQRSDGTYSLMTREQAESSGYIRTLDDCGLVFYALPPPSSSSIPHSRHSEST